MTAQQRSGDCTAPAKRYGPFRFARAARFGVPQLVDASAGLEAVSGAICPQRPSRLENVMGRPTKAWPQSEDCLHLNVVTPSEPGPHPVVVFLHGGAFITGSGLDAWYDGARLATEQRVVVVCVNYRIGPLGWLALDEASPGNLGLLDQIAALRWVHNAVSRFGGDPGNVTLMGQSAGGTSIGMLLRIPEARALFQRAIIESAPPLRVLPQQDEARTAGRRLAESLDGNPSGADVESLLDAAGMITGELAKNVGGVAVPPWSPTLGLYPMADESSSVLNPSSLDLLVGWNHDELSAFGNTMDESPALSQHLFGDAWSQESQQVREAGGRVTSYRFDWRPHGSAFGATHCLELPLLLGTEEAWDTSPMLGRETGARNGSMGRQLRGAWGEFARSGVVDPLGTPDVPIRWGIENNVSASD